MLDHSPATIRVDLRGPLEGRHVLVDFRRVDFLALRLGRGVVSSRRGICTSNAQRPRRIVKCLAASLRRTHAVADRVA